MAVPTAWYWCPGCGRAFAGLRGQRDPECSYCHKERGITWEEARTLHEELPEQPASEGEQHLLMDLGLPPDAS